MFCSKWSNTVSSDVAKIENEYNESINRSAVRDGIILKVTYLSLAHIRHLIGVSHSLISVHLPRFFIFHEPTILGLLRYYAAQFK